MVVGGYALDLYCDSEHCQNQSPHGWMEQGKAQFNGETWSECAARARKLGWRISRDRMRCLCPSCVKVGQRVE